MAAPLGGRLQPRNPQASAEFFWSPATPQCGNSRGLGRRNHCDLNDAPLYALHNAAPHKGVFKMISMIARALAALFAPLARELERMPPAALRHILAGL
jgi:hypothetical protein